MPNPIRSSHQTAIAHRGASAYAPENTLLSYQLAVDQGADCIELDLHATKDGALVCMHDRSLERTTNAREAFQHGRTVTEEGRAAPHWFVHDFTLADIKTLDCGSWFGPTFAGAEIQTFDEVLDWAKGRTTILAELKQPEAYQPLGIDLLRLFDRAVRRHGIVGSRPAEPVVTVQSFHEPTMRRAKALCDRCVPIVLLLQPAEASRLSGPESLMAIARFADGIGPEKSVVRDRPQLVGWAHDARVRVTPWTFRAADAGGFESVRAEMEYYLSALDVDAVITDNPDQFPLNA